MNVPKRIKYKGQIHEQVELKESTDNSIQQWNKDAGKYYGNVYKPKIDTQTGAYIIPKEIFDMWN